MRRSFGGAFGVSAVTHAAVFLLVLFVTARMPDPGSTQRMDSAAAGTIVWIPRADRSGGGDGGGNRTPDPPRRAEAPGADRVTVAPATFPEPSVEPRVATPRQPVHIDALPMAAGITELPGIIAPIPSSSPSLGPGSGASAGDGRRAGIGGGDGLGVGDGRDRGSGGGVLHPGAAGVTFPRLIREVPPQYTDAALRARVQGVVELRAVVREDGSVGDVWVTRSLDGTFGLDQEAVRTVKRWRFVPAMQRGRAVAAVVPIEMRFTIQ